MANRFNSFKKGISKVKNISPKIKGNLNRKKSKKKSDESKSGLGIEYIVPESSPLRKNSEDDTEFSSSEYLDDFPDAVGFVRSGDDSGYLDDFPDAVGFVRSGDDSGYLDDFPDAVGFVRSGDDSIADAESYDNSDFPDDLDEVDRKYAKYIFGDNADEINYDTYKDSYSNGDLGDIAYAGENSDFDTRLNKNYDDFNENYSKEVFKNFNNDLDNNDETYGNNSSSDENYSDFYDEKIQNKGFNGNSDLGNLKNRRLKEPSKDIKTNLLDFKMGLLNKDDKSKSRFGKIVAVLILLVLASSIFYFFVYQPFQDQLNLERNAKLNELNTLYNGPLEAHENAYTLKSQIESENSIEELKLMDILTYATKDWRNYHKSKIVSSKDNFGRVMLVYGDENKNIIMSVKDANEFVKDNDAKVLSNIRFEKVDTTIVPISISRLQATAGLISVGSIVDIYSLSDNYSSEWDSSSDSDVDSSQAINDSSGSDLEDDDGQDLNAGDDDLKSDITNSDDSRNSDYSEVSDGSESSSSFAPINEDSGESGFSAKTEPDVSGATVLAILRSKDSGVIDSSISESNTFIKGNATMPYENTSSYSNDVEELLKASVFNSYDDNKALESYLGSYGIKLSNYERMSNLADLDSEYLILLEVPRSDVSFVINNMDNLILTIPTEFAPNWVVSELNETYYDNIYNYDLNSTSFLEGF